MFNGKYECLKYAYEHGCPWINNSNTCRNAAGFGYLDCLKYAIENDCSYDKDECLVAAKKNQHQHIIDYLDEL